MYNRGFYSYQKENTNIKTLYSIEYTFNKDIFDRMDKASFDYSELTTKKFDFLEDAIQFYNTLLSNENTLHLLMLEQIIFNDEIVLEQEKDFVTNTAIKENYNKAMYKENEILQQENAELKKEIEKYKSFLKKYNVSI